MLQHMDLSLKTEFTPSLIAVPSVFLDDADLDPSSRLGRQSAMTKACGLRSTHNTLHTPHAVISENDATRRRTRDDFYYDGCKERRKHNLPRTPL
jgi:hypothetical protein